MPKAGQAKTLKKKTMDFIIGTILFYSILCALLYFSQRSMLYFPGGAREDVTSLTQFKPDIIKVESEEGITFNAWYWPAKENKPTILFFHGNGQAYQFWINKMMTYHAQGYGIFFTDYRGYGGVGGAPTEQGLYTDARAHINALMAETGLTPNSLVYYGESLGTGVAIQMATEFPPKAIILESAYSATDDVAKSRYWMFPVDLLMKDKFRSIDKVSTLTMPKFQIHAQKDQVIPAQFGQALFDAMPEPKKWVSIKNGGHNDLYDNGAQLHISDFLSTITIE